MGVEQLTLLPVSMSPGSPIVSVPPSEIDGAVVELAIRHDGTITAEVRIPAHQSERM